MTSTPKTDCEREFDFTLVLDGVSEVTPEIADALFEAGCYDATLSVRMGRAYLTFSRRSASLSEAIVSAIDEVHSSGTGATVLRVDECNLVTQADIARRIGRTRQLVSLYIKGERGPGGFPPPACKIADNAPLWYWCEVSRWLWENSMLQEQDYMDAQDIANINSLLEISSRRRQSPPAIRRLLESLHLCGSRG